jgi:hypothetical protein
MVMRFAAVLLLLGIAFGFAAFAVFAGLEPVLGAAGAAGMTALVCLAAAGLAAWLAYRAVLAFKALRIDPMLHAVRRTSIVGGQVVRAPARYPLSSAGLGAGAVGVVVLLRYLRRLLGRVF